MGSRVSLALVSDAGVTANGYVREVSPAIDAKSSTIRVKVAIQDPPAAMTLGSAVAGTVKAKAQQQIALPWSALMAAGIEARGLDRRSGDQDGCSQAGDRSAATKPAKC